MYKKTSKGLVIHCEKALKEKWLYLWGAYGQNATKEYIESNIKQYPENKKWLLYLNGGVNKTKVSDCYGLVKSYLWTGNNKLLYNPKEDINSEGAFLQSIEKGELKTMPDLAGAILYMKGHAGIYVGNNKFIECVGGGVGMSLGLIEDNKIIKGSRFTHWFKDKNILYDDNSFGFKINEEDYQKIKIYIDSKENEIYSIMKENYNMVFLRELADLLEYNVEYSFDTKEINLSKRI